MTHCFTFFLPHTLAAQYTKQWHDERIGFHLSNVNPILIRNINHLIPVAKEEDDTASSSNKDGDGNADTCYSVGTGTSSSGGSRRVFVPLCGKAVDMAYLAGLESVEKVVGVDGISVAIEEFAKEQPQLNVQRVSCDDDTATGKNSIDHSVEQWDGKKISLFVADFFGLTETETLLGSKFDAIYDRGSLVAINPNMRDNYLDVIGKLIAPGGKILLVTLERRGDDEAVVKKGPPFSISETTVRALFEPLEWVDKIDVLEVENIIDSEPPEKVRGLNSYLEIVFLITATK